jgi:hypothetical protein
MTGVNRESKIKNVRWPEALDTKSSQRMGSKRKKVQKLAKTTRKEVQHSQGQDLRAPPGGPNRFGPKEGHREKRVQKG